MSRLFGEHCGRLAMSSTKSSLGTFWVLPVLLRHILYSSVRDQVVPATINLDHPSLETNIDLVPNTPQERVVDVVMSNSFGFGGTNASLCFRKI